MGQHPGYRKWKPRKLTAYAGPTTCLRCDKVFESWDRRQNRLCQTCRETIAAEPSDEPSHSVPKRKGRPHDDC